MAPNPLLGKPGETILAVGVYDALGAKLAERAGFRLLFLSGFGVSASRLGEPDFGLLGQEETIDAARRVAGAVRTPVVVDGDTGGGGVLNVRRLVTELLRAGAAGVILEDQVWPKRCGHMRGKSVVPAEEHVAKLRAAADARGEAPFVVAARTDARAPLGLDEAIRRGNAYREAGADLIFVEAPQSLEEIRRIPREIPGPLLLNMVEGGRTPILPLTEIARLGFTHCVYPVTGILAAARATADAFANLAREGRSDAGAPPPAMGFEEFTELLGLEEKYALDERFRS